MAGYAHLKDALPCPKGDEHDWLLQSASSGENVTEYECSECAALALRWWWGWEFKTGDEHFEDAQREMGVPVVGAYDEPIRRIFEDAQREMGVPVVGAYDEPIRRIFP